MIAIFEYNKNLQTYLSSNLILTKLYMLVKQISSILTKSLNFF